MGSGVLKAITLGFLCGVFIRSFCLVGFSFTLYMVMLALVVLGCARFDPARARSLIVVALALASCVGGIMRMNAAVLTGDPHLTATIGTEVTLIGAVSAEPDVRESEVRVDLDATQIVEGSTTIPIDAGVLAELPPHADLHYGDLVRVRGALGLPQSFSVGGGEPFDYPDYLAVSGIGYELSFAQGSSTGERYGNPLLAEAIAIKEKYVDALEAVLPEPEAGLAAGITVGDKRSIGPELSSDFQKVGLLQIVVLSGYNITVVVDFISYIFAWAPQRLRFCVGIMIAGFFVAISGGGSSALRAAIMAVIAMYARMSGRSFDALRALLSAAFLMVLVDPFILAYDPGFQLSSIAMLGLTTLAPLLDPYMQWIPSRLGLREIIVSTLATQIAVTPLILHQDGALSILSLPANILAMLPVPLAMLASFIAAVAAMIYGRIATPPALPAYVLLHYIVITGHFFASLPFASVPLGTIGAVPMAFMYSFIAGGTWLINKQKSRV